MSLLEQHKAGQKSLWKIFGCFFMIFLCVLLGIFAFWGLIAGGVIWTAKEINDTGAKNIIERVWEGPESEALSPESDSIVTPTQQQ